MVVSPTKQMNAIYTMKAPINVLRNTLRTISNSRHRPSSTHLSQATSPSHQVPVPIPSIGFSGAGFLGCYHLGVAQCLLRHGLLLPPMAVPSPNASLPILLGASAGAIVGTSLAAGIRPEDGMNVVLELRHRVKAQGGLLDVLYPGVSLVDLVWELLLPAMHDALRGDEELLLRRIQGGKLLRIALTHKARFLSADSQDDSIKAGITTPADIVKARTKQLVTKQAAEVSSAYCYIDAYRGIEDVASACLVSSYIPGLTGPARGVTDETNAAVRDATSKIVELVDFGGVKDGKTGKSLTLADILPSNGTTDDETAATVVEPFWDGGLSCVWPTVDDSTVIVCPIRARYDPNPAIYPALSSEATAASDDKEWAMERKMKSLFANAAPSAVPFHGKEVELGMDNMETLMRMVISSDDAVLEERFHCGYNDATRFLNQRGLLKVYTN